MRVTDGPISTAASEEQSKNAYLPMVVTDGPISTAASEEQP